MPHRIVALYKFVTPSLERETLKPLQKDLESFCLSSAVRGTLILSTEGINGTICYPHPSSEIDVVMNYLQSLFPGVRTRVSRDAHNVFSRLRIKIKSQIVSMGNVDVDPITMAGEYIKPGDAWDCLLKDPECLVIDTRNDYEVRLGTFQGAVNPHTEAFTEFPEWLATHASLSNKIAMFCTGGIRCEKASALAKKLFPDKLVYHLEGGILAYLDAVPEDQSKFQGECYVFDQRVAVTHGLRPSDRYVACFACRRPLSPVDRVDASYREGVSCKYCIDAITERQRQRFEARNKQIELATRKGKQHIHDSKYYAKETNKIEFTGKG